jgi:hypothetical protein
MPDYPCITILGPIRAAGEPNQDDIVLPAPEAIFWK